MAPYPSTRELSLHMLAWLERCAPSFMQHFLWGSVTLFRPYAIVCMGSSFSGFFVFLVRLLAIRASLCSRIRRSVRGFVFATSFCCSTEHPCFVKQRIKNYKRLILHSNDILQINHRTIPIRGNNIGILSRMLAL